MLIEGADYFVRFIDFPNDTNCGGMVLLTMTEHSASILTRAAPRRE